MVLIPITISNTNNNKLQSLPFFPQTTDGGNQAKFGEEM